MKRCRRGGKKRKRLVLKVKASRKNLRREKKDLKRIMPQDKNLAFKLREKEWRGKDRNKESKELKREIMIPSRRAGVMVKDLIIETERKEKKMRKDRARIEEVQKTERTIKKGEKAKNLKDKFIKSLSNMNNLLKIKKNPLKLRYRLPYQAV